MDLRGSSSGHQTQLNGGSAKMGKSKTLLTTVVVVVLLVVIGLGVGAYKMANANAGVKTNQYQAVFLTSDQVYFGKLRNINDRYVELTDIYYLQVQQSVQPADNNNQQDPKVSLAKLGSELHGPEDIMQINRDQVLFWENLKDDSKVVSAIKENQNK